MVDPINITTDIAVNLLSEVGKIGLYIQALGLFVILWIGFQIYALHNAVQKKQTLSDIKDDIQRVERKVDKLIKK